MTDIEESAAIADMRRRGEDWIRLGRQMIAQATLMDQGEATPSSTLTLNAAALSRAKEAYDARTRRKHFFRVDLFGEPAWDIMLDLFVRQEVGLRTAVTAACIGSGAPHTTALRYISMLTEEGLVESHGDPRDNRRRWLTLTDEARDALREYFAQG